jgi:N-acetylmuramoyl-L-alanine amidase
MDRRKFIKILSIISVFVFDLKQALANLLPQNSTADFLTIQFENDSPFKIPILWKNGLVHISVSELATSLKHHTYFNDAKKKIVLYLQQNKLVITANNAFVIVDEETYQMPAPAIWQSPDIFVPVKYFLPLIHRRTTLNISYDPNRQHVQISEKDINITGVSISSRENGTVIRIKSFKEFGKGEITADMRYGWLHVDLYNGKLDRELIEKAQTSGIVRKIKTFQFEELASIAFLVRDVPFTHEIIQNAENNEIMVVLRTDSTISEERESEPSAREEEEFNQVKKQLEQEREKWLIDVVIIDPGHGGKDPGTVGKSKTYEKDIVLEISRKLGKIIKKEMPDVKVIYTRNSDKFIPLQKRTKIANENNGKVFISIHANSVNNRRVSGFETYILGPEKGEKAKEVVLKENSVINFEDSKIRAEYEGINQILATMAQSAFSRQSEYLAYLVQQEMEKELRGLKLKNRGVKQGPFWVMVGATMPNILVEAGFLSNSYDLKVLKTAAYQYKIAQGIFEGFKRYKRDYESTI